MSPSDPIDAIQDGIVAEFQSLKDWDERYRHIIAMGKALPPIQEAYRDEAHQVKGCQSTVWMHAEQDAEGNVVYHADSDAMIVRGLVALLLRVYSGHSPQAILKAEPTFLERIEMGKHLSMQRSNGLAAMLKQMKLYAMALQLRASQA